MNSFCSATWFLYPPVAAAAAGLRPIYLNTTIPSNYKNNKLLNYLTLKLLKYLSIRTSNVGNVEKDFLNK
jgi:hypothetical protein